MIQLCVFSSTPDIEGLNFIVKVLTGELEELLVTARKWGYDGIEFLPDPLHIPSPETILGAMEKTGSSVHVLNTGRLAAQGMTLFHKDTEVRRQSMNALKDIIDLAGEIGARVGIGMARGIPDPSLSLAELDSLIYETFTEIATHAEKRNVVTMLEPIDPGASGVINTMSEAVSLVKRINSPGLTVMMDTYQILEVEESFERGVDIADGRANHIHLYDPSRWPPGVLPEGDRLDWPMIAGMLKDKNFVGSGSVVLAPEGDPNVSAPAAARYLKKLFA